MSTSKPLIYLASPHTHADPARVNIRFDQAQIATILLMQQGFIVYSPIVYTHPLWRLSQSTKPGCTLHGLGEWKHEDWLEFDRHMMERCDKCLVLAIDGWDTSKGVALEMDYFTKAGKPVYFASLFEIIQGRRFGELNSGNQRS